MGLFSALPVSYPVSQNRELIQLTIPQFISPYFSNLNWIRTCGWMQEVSKLLWRKLKREIVVPSNPLKKIERRSVITLKRQMDFL